MNVYPYLIQQLYTGTNNDLIELIYGRNFTFGVYEHTYKDGSFDYFIINDGFFKYRSQLFGGPLPESNLERLNKNYLLDEVYNNKGIQIYKVERG